MRGMSAIILPVHCAAKAFCAVLPQVRQASNSMQGWVVAAQCSARRSRVPRGAADLEFAIGPKGEALTKTLGEIRRQDLLEHRLPREAFDARTEPATDARTRIALQRYPVRHARSGAGRAPATPEISTDTTIRHRSSGWASPACRRNGTLVGNKRLSKPAAMPPANRCSRRNAHLPAFARLLAPPLG